MAFSHVHVADHVQSSYQWCGTEFANASLRGAYGDAVMEMDWVVGQILSTLTQLQLDQNTIVFFTSDNGPWLCEGKYGGSAGLFKEGKFSTWEGGIRVPGIVKWPGTIQPLSQSNELVSTMDIFPTIANLAGATLPDVVIDGKDMMPILKQTGKSQHDFLFFHNGGNGNYTVNAIRYGSYKAHYITRTSCPVTPTHHNPPLLFNVDIDPSEKYPLDPTEYSSLLAQFDAALANLNKNLIPGPDQGNAGSKQYEVCCNTNTKCVCGQPASGFLIE